MDFLDMVIIGEIIICTIGSFVVDNSLSNTIKREQKKIQVILNKQKYKRVI